MDLKQLLDIIIITWNRKDYLEKTLNSIFEDTSPIKNCDIVILDNASTDGTSELIKTFQAEHKNITHIINKYNVGGNANICRAMEIPTKKYFWILCDDDDYDWSNWQEIETAINQDYDAIMLEYKHTIPKENNEGYILNNMAFLPSTIYKTENINNTVMYNAYCNILYSLPHLALSCYLINENKKIYVASKPIITAGIHVHVSVKADENIHIRARNMNLFNSFISSYQMLKDKTVKERACDVLCQGKSFSFSMEYLFSQLNPDKYALCDIFWGISSYQKIIFLVKFLRYNLMFFTNEPKGIKIHLFGNKFKTYIWWHIFHKNS